MSSSSWRRRRQRGGSIIEALVATALLGLTASVALIGWDATVLAANRATREAWARCVARAQMEAVLAAPWRDDHDYVRVADRRVTVVAPTVQYGLQRVTVTVSDPQSGSSYRISSLKAKVLSGVPGGPPPAASPISQGCPSP